MYYVVIVQNDTTQAIISYSSLDEALSRYHTELAYGADERTSTKCAILDHDLAMLRQEVYTAPVSNSIEEPTEG